MAILMFCAIRTPPFLLKNTNGKYTLQTDAMCTYHLKRLLGKQDCWSLDRSRAVALQDGRAPVLPIPQESPHLCHHCKRLRDGVRKIKKKPGSGLNKKSPCPGRPAYLGLKILYLNRLSCSQLASSWWWSSPGRE